MKTALKTTLILLASWNLGQNKQIKRIEVGKSMKNRKRRNIIYSYMSYYLQSRCIKHNKVFCWYKWELLICFNLRYKNEAKWRPAVSAVVKFFTVGGLLGNCLVTGLLLFISHHNYPGGVALQRLHTLLENQTGRRNTLRNWNSHTKFCHIIYSVMLFPWKGPWKHWNILFVSTVHVCELKCLIILSQ